MVLFAYGVSATWVRGDLQVGNQRTEQLKLTNLVYDNALI